ncbi:MAG: transposase family protein, partial [Chloroflexi bacterium]|nr:transposase family protein [Chloroflexota bacterium]
PTRRAVPCPECGQLSERPHSSYFRRPLDLPWRGHTVRLRVHSRRWFCDVIDQSYRRSGRDDQSTRPTANRLYALRV